MHSVLEQFQKHRVIPVVEYEGGGSAPPLPSARNSYIPDIMDLVNENGARFVFVRAPLAPGNTQDDTSAEVDRDAVAYLNEVGAGSVDLRTLGLGG